MGLNSSERSKVVLAYLPDDTFQAASRALSISSKYKVKEVNKAARTLAITSGVSMKSWGENLLVTINPNTEGMSEVLISSSSKFGVVDWGKNQDNMREISGLIVKELENGEYKKVLSPTQEPDIPDQIRKLAELKDSGIITEVEFQEKKEELLNKM